MANSAGSSLERPSHENKSDSAWYQYEPLQSPSHIRVLKIEPGDQDDPLRCSLVQVNLDDGPIFKALSYAWGDANHLRKVECDGKIVDVTQNLYDALEMMRLKNVKILWADAICINQRDLVERGAQVQLMSRIYSQADRVLLWLGSHDQNCIDTALTYLELLDSSGEKSSLNPGKEIEDALRHLIACPVFGRGWVIQEVALAKRIDIHWGHAVMDFARFYSAIVRHWRTLYGVVLCDNEKAEMMLTLFSMRDIRQTQQQGRTIDPLSLMKKSRSHHFSDERDRIYGLLALRIQGTEQFSSRTFVQADYTNDKWHAFRAFTEACLIREGLLATLVFAYYSDETNMDRPSWVPDWCKPNYFWGYSDKDKISYGDERFPIQKDNETQISIRGISVTYVESLLGCHTFEHTQEEAQALLRTIWSSFESTCVAKTASVSTSYLEQRLLTFVDNEHNLCDVLTNACRKFLEQDLREEPLPRAIFPAVDESPIGHLYGRIYLDCSHHQMFFRSSQGNLGLGTRNLQEGDTIAILFSSSGPNLPFVLRPAGSSWKLVGPCYMYHLTDGSAVREWKESGEPAETFIIS